MPDVVMTKILSLFSLAAAFNGTTWWAYFTMAPADDTAAAGHAASTHSAGITELIQLGGTGGLIAALIAAIFALMKDRDKVSRNHKDEMIRLSQILETERTQHTKNVEILYEQHKREIAEMTECHMKTLYEQIALLREEGRQNFEPKSGN
jgi:hypothetical protein